MHVLLRWDVAGGGCPCFCAVTYSCLGSCWGEWCDLQLNLHHCYCHLPEYSHVFSFYLQGPSHCFYTLLLTFCPCLWGIFFLSNRGQLFWVSTWILWLHESVYSLPPRCFLISPGRSFVFLLECSIPVWPKVFLLTVSSSVGHHFGLPRDVPWCLLWSFLGSLCIHRLVLCWLAHRLFLHPAPDGLGSLSCLPPFLTLEMLWILVT